MEKTAKNSGMGIFERYLTVWVALCIIVGIAVGKWLPAIPQTLGQWEYANVSIPVAILIWLMIYPMMLKVDFQSVKNVGRRPKGIVITCVINWIIKPLTMYGIAWLFFFVAFKHFIPTELADQYLAGAVLLGAAPCTAMVFVWSYLTKGDAAYTLVQVAINDLIHWRLLKSVNAKLLNSVFMLVTRFSGLQTLSHFSNDYIGVGALKLGSPIFHECRTIHFQPDC